MSHALPFNTQNFANFLLIPHLKSLALDQKSSEFVPYFGPYIARTGPHGQAHSNPETNNLDGLKGRDQSRRCLEVPRREDYSSFSNVSHNFMKGYRNL